MVYDALQRILNRPIERDDPVTPTLRGQALERAVSDLADLRTATDPVALVEGMADILRQGLIHVVHPRCFGFFNPSVTPAGVAAEALAAHFNAQLAVVAQAPGAVVIEERALAVFREMAGFASDAAAHFTNGGGEANHTAVLAALSSRVPGFRATGLRGADRDPVILVAESSHATLRKSVRGVGLGDAALIEVPCDDRGRLDPRAAVETVEAERAAGRQPVLLVATAGTTAGGTIDSLNDLADVAEGQDLWFHVDAAYGGAALFSPGMRDLLVGIERADSITIDAHKWLAAPLVAGVFLCRHPAVLLDLFDPGSTAYMPGIKARPDAYRSTFAWSRRAMGLKVFAVLAELGLDGVAAMIDRMTALGDELRSRLGRAGWRIVNDTPLPVVCFDDDAIASGQVTAGAIASRVVRRKKAWLSDVEFRGQRVLRACISSHRTDEGDLDVLVSELETARREAGGAART